MTGDVISVCVPLDIVVASAPFQNIIARGCVQIIVAVAAPQGIGRSVIEEIEKRDAVQKEVALPIEKVVVRAPVQSIGSEFDAQIKAGNSPSGGFTDVSGAFQPVGSTKTFSLDTKGQKFRYYVVWLKLPFEGGQAEIAEVTART